MSATKDGGPAFPCELFDEHDGGTATYREAGMSLRAYFAGQALGGLARGFLQHADVVGNAPGVAEDCVKIADALIAELRRAK